MRAPLAVLLLALRASAQAEDDACDVTYACRASYYGIQWDLSPLCAAGNPYAINMSVAVPPDFTFMFQICGNLPANSCVPKTSTRKVQYSRGVAVQYVGTPPDPGAICTNNLGQPAPCTRDCEVLAVGTPTFVPFDLTDPAAGINSTYIGVDAIDGDACPRDFTGASGERTLTIAVLCDQSGGQATVVQSVREYATCQYELIVSSPAGCGLVPDCYNRNCGPDGAGGYCGGAGNAGQCDPRFSCVDGQCCRADCANRYCGDDGCGGSCGSCTAGQQCTRSRQCVSSGASQSPAPSLLPTNSLMSTSTSGDYMASFLGGAVSVPAVLAGAWVVTKVRSAMALL